MEYGLIGEKLGHSFSKAIHEMIADYTYELKEIKKEDFDKFMIDRDFKCINVTIPYKKDVIPYLDFISEEAKKIGAVNTIINKDGKLYGYNTDYYGLKLLIQKQNIELTDKNVLVLGTGGTSLTAKAVLSDLNAKKILQASRQNSSEYISYDEIYNYDINYIVNTTPIGMYPNNSARLIDVSKFKNLRGLVDVVYNPLSTNLVLDAKELNIKANGGLYMLIAQAVYAIKLFKNKEIDDAVIDAIYHKLVKEKLNIVLIGMPSCGKTTIGSILSKKRNKELFDIESLIVDEVGMEIKDYMKLNDEKSFREVESNIVKEVSKGNNSIISTGGGVILNKNNIVNLKQNGLIVFIDRKLENLTPTASRPLTSNFSDLEKKYNERINLYREYADIVVDNNKNIDDAINKIMEVLNNEIISY